MTSIAEYLRIERAALEKSEYFRGDIYPRGVCSIRHNIISGNVLSHFYGYFQDRSLEVYGSDLRLAVPAGPFYTYADLLVIEGEPTIDRYDCDTITNPCLIVQIYSAESVAYDLGAKFHRLLPCESLREYLLISEEETRVERRLRREDGAWLVTWHDSLDSTLELATGEVQLPLTTIYEGVEEIE
jgi:Uma2 family endonuclease